MLVDFIISLVIILSATFGFRRGFCSMLFSFVAFFLSIVITLTLYGSFSQKVLNTEIGKEVQTSVSEGVNKYLSDITAQTIDKLPFMSLAENNTDTNNDTDAISAKITKKAIDIIMAVILLVCSYIVSKIIIFLLRKILHTVTGLPVIHLTDSVLGLICGVFFGIVWSAVIYTAVGYFSLIDSIPLLKSQFESSIIVLLISDFIM